MIKTLTRDSLLCRSLSKGFSFLDITGRRTLVSSSQTVLNENGLRVDVDTIGSSVVPGVTSCRVFCICLPFEIGHARQINPLHGKKAKLLKAYENFLSFV